MGGPGFGLGNYGGSSKGANDSLATGMDIALSSKLLTDFRLGYYRYNVIDTKYDSGRLHISADTLGIPGINSGPGQSENLRWLPHPARPDLKSGSSNLRPEQQLTVEQSSAPVLIVNRTATAHSTELRRSAPAS